MRTAAPAMLKKLTNVIAVPETAMGKSSLAWGKVNIPKPLKNPMKKKMRPYQKGLWIFRTPTRRKRPKLYKLNPKMATLFVD